MVNIEPATYPTWILVNRLVNMAGVTGIVYTISHGARAIPDWLSVLKAGILFFTSPLFGCIVVGLSFLLEARGWRVKHSAIAVIAGGFLGAMVAQGR